LKHASASALDISLIRDADGIAITVEDNGKGFDPEQLKQSEGIGTQNIRSRVQFLKGTVEFDSKAGKGTLVAIHIPN
ncbi:MAG TPA: ATP-binding protein, partial [Ferruginibacter sp.]|nr:ATP-binding protein [Ferruginibacter sp.]